MANEDLGEIRWKVGVDTSDLTRATVEQDDFTEAGERAQKKIKKSTDEMSKGFSQVSSAVKLVTGALVALGATRALTNTIKTTNEFTASISELSAITGAAGDDLAYLAAQSKDIGRTTTLSASQAATAFKLIASAKPDLLESGEALNMVTREAVSLAEAAKIDLPTAADSLGNALNQFGAGADQASRFINVLAAGSKLGSSSISDTAQAMKNAGAAANALGVDFETANAAIQALSAGGLKAAEAGTGLRNILVILEQEADANLRPSVVGLTKALENLEAQNLSNTEKIDLFGRMNLIAGQTMLDQLPILQKLEQELRGTNVAYEQARINNDNLAGDLKQTQSAAEGLQIALGEKMTPALRDATQEFTELLVAATRFVESEEFGETVETVKTAVDLLAIALGSRLVVALTSSAAKFFAAATMAGTFSRAITLMGGPLGIATMAVYGLVKALDALEDKQRTAISGAIEKAAQEGLESLDLFIIGQAMKLNELYAELDKAQELRGHKRRNEIARITREIDEQNAIMMQASKRREELLEKQADAQAELTDNVDQSAHVMAYYNTQVTESGIVTEELTNKTADLIRELETKLNLIGMSERDQFLYNEQLKLGADATLDQRLEVERLAGALFDKMQADKAAEQASRDAAKADKDRAGDSQLVAEAIQRDWERTRDFISRALRQAGDNGFGSILDTSRRVLEQIAYDWAAAKIMDLTGISALIGAGGLGSGGGLTGGGIANAAASGASSSFFSNVAGGALGAAGASLAFNASQAASLGKIAIGAGGNSMVSPALARQTLGQGLSGFGFNQGNSLFTSGNFNLQNLGVNLAAGAAGSFVGNELGQAIFNKEAESAIGATVGSVAGSFFGPLGTAIGGAIGGLIDTATGGDGFKRGMAGFLSGNTPGAPSGSTFSVPSFASGLNVTGFADGPVTRQQATNNINAFRNFDAQLFDLVTRAGGSVDLSRATLGGFGIDGKAGTQGTFFGQTQRTTEADARAQMDSFAKQFAGHVSGIDLMGADTAEKLVDRLRELVESNEKLQEANTTAARSFRTASTVGRSSSFSGGGFGGSISSGLATAQWVEDKRRERVANNLRKRDFGYNFSTGEWDESQGGLLGYLTAQTQMRQGIPAPPAPMLNHSVSAQVPTTEEGDTLDKSLMTQMAFDIRKLAKLNSVWDKSGQPETRTTTPGGVTT